MRNRDYDIDKEKVLGNKADILKRKGFLRRYYLEIILYIVFAVAVLLFMFKAVSAFPVFLLR